MAVSTDRFRAAIDRIDAANRGDPHPETSAVDGETYPKEYLYGLRMSDWLDRFAPDASEALRLAARAQHIRRWEIPRDRYPRDRRGYHLWRTELYGHHADCAEEILREVGYDDATGQRVRDLLMKKGLRSDPEMQTLEDVICLVFLNYYFLDFAKDHEEEKVVRILQRTWKKMSEKGREAALQLDLPDEARRLIERALAE
jgi:hypothetical protein